MNHPFEYLWHNKKYRSNSVVPALTGKTIAESIAYLQTLQTKYGSDTIFSNGKLTEKESDDDVILNAVSKMAQKILYNDMVKIKAAKEKARAAKAEQQMYLKLKAKFEK